MSGIATRTVPFRVSRVLLPLDLVVQVEPFMDRVLVRVHAVPVVEITIYR